MLQAMWQSVFSPRTFLDSAKGRLITDRIGWVFIVIRWLYYSLVFTLARDYYGAQKPLVAPPFGMSLNLYTRLQRTLALPFGLFLMLSMSAALWCYLAAVRRRVSLFKLLNTFGVTFFLPFLLLQPFDLALVRIASWKMPAVVPLHSAVLVWECLAAMTIVGEMAGLKPAHKVLGAAISGSVWILLCSLFWR